MSIGRLGFPLVLYCPEALTYAPACISIVGAKVEEGQTKAYARGNSLRDPSISRMLIEQVAG